MKTKTKIGPYTTNQVVATMLVYQIISKVILVLGAFLFRALTGMVMWSLDRPAVTSGDLPFFFRSWQGWVLIIFGLLSLLFYIALDINLSIILSDKLLRGERPSPKGCIGEAIRDIKLFLSPRGILLVLYIAFIAPIVGAPFDISLTRSFVIPDFIMSFIQSHLPLLILYSVFVIFFLIIGFMGLFVFHNINIKKQSVKDANRNSRELIKNNLKYIIKRTLSFAAISLICLVIIVGVLCILPLWLIRWTDMPTEFDNFALIFIGLLIVTALSIYLATVFTYMFLRITWDFGVCDEEMQGQYLEFAKSKKLAWVIVPLCIMAVVGVTSSILNINFDEYFPPLNKVNIIAHRAGGDLANENTTLGVKKAIEHGAFGTETDVQRTKDGFYIINHDNDFKRLCGVEKTSSEMTLKEIKTLKVMDEHNANAPTQDVPTLEEFLDSGKDKINFYIELKGSTADEKMADDIYEIVKAKGMLNQSVFIGLDYNLINYISEKYPDANTGYLCFFSIGEIEDLNCNVLMPEMETATSSNIEKIGAAGKRTDVWTVNSVNAIVDFMLSDATGIVTDKVEDARVISEFIMDNQDIFRILKPIFD